MAAFAVMPPQDVFLTILIEIDPDDFEVRVRIVRDAAGLPDTDHVIRAGGLGHGDRPGEVPVVPSAVPRFF
jgi:hypothetical protein